MLESRMVKAISAKCQLGKRPSLPAEFVDGFDKGNGVFRRCLGDDAVTEVKDVAGTAGGLAEDFFGAVANFGFVGQQHEWIEIALNGFGLADGFPGVVEAN